MGGQSFYEKGKGKTAQEAFDELVKQAQYDYGHAGYTGTIAEKSSFVVVESPIDDVQAFVDAVADYSMDGQCHIGSAYEAVVARAAKIYDDKWGPALCVPLKTDKEKFVFCGFASS